MTFILESALMATGMAATAAEATALAGTVSSVASAASTVAGAVGSIVAGNQANDLAKYNATISMNNANAAEAAGQQEAGRLHDINRRRIGAARATQGASGADMNLGSPVDVQADLAGQAALDEEIARWRGQVTATGYQNQAQSQLYQGQIAQSQAWGKAGAMILSGFGRLGGAGSPTAPSSSWMP